MISEFVTRSKNLNEITLKVQEEMPCMKSGQIISIPVKIMPSQLTITPNFRRITSLALS